MQLLDSALITIPTAFFLLMAVDFIAGLVKLGKQHFWTTQEVAHILEIIDSVPLLEQEPVALVEAESEDEEEECEKLEYAYLPDPWMLPVDDVEVIIPTATKTTEPCLRLLAPAKSVDLVASPKKKAGRPKKNSPLDAEFSPNSVAKGLPENKIYR